MTDARDRALHVMEFPHHEEAAAFVAALSRFLNSPTGSVYSTRGSLVEVWAESPASGSVLLFLTKGALTAAESAFSPLQVGPTVSRKDLPAASFLLIEGGKTPPWGASDAAARLARKHSDHTK